MTRYLRIEGDDGKAILIELAGGDEVSSLVVTEEVTVQIDAPVTGPVLPTDSGRKVGLRERARSTVTNIITETQEVFQQSVATVINFNAELLLNPLRSLKEPPSEVELSFDLKVTGEAGLERVAVTKLGGEAAYGVKLTWKDLKAQE
jgi:hypothetical protein